MCLVRLRSLGRLRRAKRRRAASPFEERGIRGSCRARGRPRSPPISREIATFSVAVRACVARVSRRSRRCSHKVSERRHAVAARRHAKLAVGGIAHIDAADVARIVADFEFVEPVAFGHENAEPRRVIVQGK